MVVRAVRIRWVAALVAAVSKIEVVQHGMTWYEHDLERIAESVNS